MIEWTRTCSRHAVFIVALAGIALIGITNVARAESPFTENLPTISWEDTKDHYGEQCIVTGKVVAAKDIGSRCFLNFAADYRTTFTVVVTKANYGKFPDRPDKLYQGKNVRVVGKVIEYRNKPEIIITGPDQIQIVNAEGVQIPVAAAPAGKPAAPPPPRFVPPTTPWKAPADGIIRLATFNTENLFDDYDDPYVENEYLPGKSADAQKQLATTIRRINADVLALQEIENRDALGAFVATYLPDAGYREIVQFEGNSNRGIDVALLSRLPVGTVTSHRHLVFPDENGKPIRFQRDLPQVQIKPPGFEPFDIYVVHLKSKYGGPEIALPIRMGEARTIRQLFDHRLASEPDARFAILGDFNDTIESKPLQRLIGTGSTALRSHVDSLPSLKRITLKNWDSMVDFIFTSPAMDATYVTGSYDVLVDPNDTNGSDHNPVVAAFRLTPAR